MNHPLERHKASGALLGLAIAEGLSLLSPEQATSPQRLAHLLGNAHSLALGPETDACLGFGEKLVESLRAETELPQLPPASLSALVPLAILFPRQISSIETYLEAKDEPLDELAQESARIYTVALNLALTRQSKNLNPGTLQAAAAPVLQTSIFSEFLESFPQLYLAQPTTILALYGTPSTWKEVIPVSLWLALRLRADFRVMITSLLSLDPSLHRLAPVTGALVGATNGDLALPISWRNALVGGNRIVELADALCELSASDWA